MQNIRKHTVASEKFPLVEQFLSSGVSKKSFCQAHGLAIHLMDYWLRKFRQQQADNTGKFVPVQIKPSQEVVPGKVEILCPSGVRVLFSGQLPARYLSELIQNL